MPRRAPLEAEMYDHLGPSRFSAQGFLGKDTREFEEILADDAQTLQGLGVSKDRLLKALRDVYDQALQAGGEPVAIRAGVVAECLECRGRVPSPFPGEGTFPKHQVRVFREDEEQSFAITPLALHLIDRHDFFQGIGSPFRIDPAQAVALLGLAGT
ncbi:hypothetical protein [Desulfonatronum thioautotrophicum]|uniref:hypothetical protein n=1 Tax=Desulfonatronum thioautotrophicum TaxID=617001 RepID=UPI0005EBEA2A|nr:hypothetical protein [Desulfonatronum thioautotrophicum]